VQAVNIVNVHAKRRNFSHKRKRISDWGPRWKKAVVTLNPGQHIEIFEGV
jgi:ribosomal protein L23